MDTVGPRMLSTGGAFFAQSLSIFDPASPNSHSILNLAILTLAVAGVIFLIVEGVLLYSIWRFRHKPGDQRSAKKCEANRRKSTAACRSKSPGPPPPR